MAPRHTRAHTYADHRDDTAHTGKVLAGHLRIWPDSSVPVVKAFGRNRRAVTGARPRSYAPLPGQAKRCQPMAGGAESVAAAAHPSATLLAVVVSNRKRLPSL